MEEYRIDPSIAFDVIELSSRGIHYANKKKTIKIAYLTASDENILSSPNLAQSNTLIDELLKRKVIDRDINVDELVDEDRESILIFLRNTAFGTEYKINLTDPKTGESFSHVLDLSSVKLKEFTLSEDSNGEYSYFLSKSGSKITFKFLTKKQEDEIKNLKKTWDVSLVAPIITKQLEFMIKSVEGIRDPMQIHQFIEKMPIKDSQDFRKFVKDNRPGLDLTYKVTAPSGDEIQVELGFGVEFFRPFFGL